jgi:hypothetical protein
MKLRKRMKRQGWIDVMLGVERHVPGKEAHRQAGQSGPRVFPKILYHRQAGVLRKQISAQEGLAEESGE